MRRLPSLLVISLLLVTACASAQHPVAANSARPLTGAEADRLANTRWLNFQSEGIGFSTTVPSPTGAVTLHGSVDYRTGTGDSSSSTAAAAGTQVGILAWTTSTVTTWPTSGTATSVPTTLPTAAGQVRALQPTSSNLDTVLGLLLQLGQNRPDDAHALQQSNARWLRADTVAGTPVDVFQGPSSTSSASTPSPATDLRYWVDAKGRLLRVDAQVGGRQQEIELAGNPFTALANPAPRTSTVN